jgi:hypothetical protein
MHKKYWCQKMKVSAAIWRTINKIHKFLVHELKMSLKLLHFMQIFCISMLKKTPPCFGKHGNFLFILHYKYPNNLYLSNIYDMPFHNCLLFFWYTYWAFTWLKIAFVKCFSDTTMSGFDNMIIQQHGSNFWLKFEEEIRRSECRKWCFRASNFKNFPGGMPPHPPSFASIRATVTFQPGYAPAVYTRVEAHTDWMLFSFQKQIKPATARFLRL